MNFIKKEYSLIKESLLGLNRKAAVIFLSAALLNVISWYYATDIFFREIYLSVKGYFPEYRVYEFFYWFAADTILLFFVPAVIIKFYFRENLKDYGVKVGEFKAGLVYTLVSILFLTVLIYLLNFITGFASDYNFFGKGELYPYSFPWHWLFLFIYVFAWEFIWRGYMLFGLYEKFGIYSVFIQMLPFVIMHVGKPPLETFSSIIGGILLGILALRTGSVIYGVIIHFVLILGLSLLP